MRGWTEPARSALRPRGPPGRALLLALALLGAWPAVAQTDENRRAPTWDAVADSAESRVGDPETTTPELEAVRERLVYQRAEAVAIEQEFAPAIAELNSRLEALGPAPAEGATEAPEIAKRRQDLTRQIAEAQAPVLEAQEAMKRTDALIGEIDRLVRQRFSAELMSRGPSPLRPDTWRTTWHELAENLSRTGDTVASDFEDPVGWRIAQRRLPLNLLLVAGGIAATFMLRRWVGNLIETRLLPNAKGRAVTWVGALHNLARLIVPVVAAGLLFAALDPGGLVARSDGGRFFRLPDFVAVLIGAGWVSASLFSPRRHEYRLVPLDDAEARRGSRVLQLLGLAVALNLLLSDAITLWDLSSNAQTALRFPLVLVGAAALWGVARVLDIVDGRLANAAAAGPPDSATLAIRARLLRLLTRLLRAIAVVATLLAVVGYMPAASYLVFPTAMTLGLLGAARVIFDLLNKTALTFLSRPTAQTANHDGGLIPVAVAMIVALAILPLLALIWGARTSDLADAWTLLMEGVTFGGMRLSASVILTLAAILALGVTLTRLFQTVLRGSVLPRTKLDAGGRNAVLAGVGYLGFGLSVLAAVTAAGLDLSNIAIVAGALSVGIGFGLQNIVSNFVSGIILLVERPVKEGDWIEVGGYSGYVRGIKVRATEIETFDRASVILPNSDLVAGTVLNRTHTGMVGRLQVPVGVTYTSDPHKVEAILLAIAESHPLVLEDPAPRVLFLELAPDSMNFELRCWLRDVNFTLSVRSDMNYDIVEQLRAANIRVQYYGRELPPEAPEEPLPVALQRAMKES